MLKMGGVKVQILIGDAARIEECLEVGRRLPEFFNQQGLLDMERDLKEHLLYIALEDQIVVGFIALELESKEVAEISWMAVAPEKQGQGVGKELMAVVVKDLKVQRLKLLKVKTLSAIADYRPYEGTRAFYEKRGFILLETIDPYEPWGLGNPCAVYVKIL